jgi:hypothetical protein
MTPVLAGWLVRGIPPLKMKNILITSGAVK